MDGVKSTNLTSASALDEYVGNQTVDGIKRSRCQSASSLAAQVAASGAMATRFGDLQGQIDAIGAGGNVPSIVRKTWTPLAAITATAAGQRGEVLGPDAGTHTDPVVGGTVPNTGIFSWSTSPAGWQRIGDNAVDLLDKPLKRQFSQLLTEQHEQIFARQPAQGYGAANEGVYAYGSFGYPNPIASTFSGWASAIDWNGYPFDAIQIPIVPEFNDKPVRVAIWDAAKVFLTSGEVMPSDGAALYTVKLDDRITIADAPAGTLWASTDSPGGAMRVGPFQPAAFVPVSGATDIYYTTTAAPEPYLADWTLAVAGPEVRPHALRLFDLATSARVTRLVGPGPNHLVMAPRFFGIQGVEMNIYPGNLHSGGGPKIYDFRAGFGTQFGASWRTTLGIAYDGPLAMDVLDPDHLSVLGTAIALFSNVLANAAAGATRRVMCIGDSTTDVGRYTQILLDHAAANPSGVQPTLIGTRGAGLNKHEGRAGWSVSAYFQMASLGGFNNAFISAPGQKFNVAHYLASTGFTAPQIVVWHLGINDVFMATTDAAVHATMDVSLDQLDRMIGLTVDAAVGSWMESAPATKHIIALPIPPAMQQDAFGLVYGDAQNRARYKRNITIAAYRICEHYKSKEADGIFLLPWNAVVDPDTGFPYASPAAANSNTTRTVERQYDAVHPNTSGFDGGYGQMADQLWAALNVLVAKGLA